MQKIPSNSSRIHILLQHAWNILQDRSYIRHKTSLNKFKKTEIISGIFSDHKGLKLEINYREKTGKFTKMYTNLTKRINNILLNNQ